MIVDCVHEGGGLWVNDSSGVRLCDLWCIAIIALCYLSIYGVVSCLFVRVVLISY